MKDDYTCVRIETPEARQIAREFVNDHHSYIKWADRPSRKMYWQLLEKGNMVGVFGLGSAFAKPKAVSSFMKENNLAFNEVANNIVYALHGHTNKNAGSILLKKVRSDAVAWWYSRYGDTLKAFQTFILPPRTGSVYKADNWVCLGGTSGGRTLTTQTVSEADFLASEKGIEKRVFSDGSVRFLLRTFRETEKKLIFMRLVKAKPKRNMFNGEDLV